MTHRLEVTAELAARGPAGALVLSDAQVADLGGGKSAPVVVAIRGRQARLRLARMGGENLVGFSKAVRADLGVEIGQRVTATITVDSAERTVEIPTPLARAFAEEPDTRPAFDALSYTRRKEIANGIASAKKPETVQRRVAAAIEQLRR